jgi:nitrous oxidase accessory protein NosD
VTSLATALTGAALAMVACGGSGTGGGAETSVARFTGARLSVADFGARGDGQAPDTAAIQAAIDAVPAGGTLAFPPGTYRVETDRGLRLKSDMRLDLGGATLVGTNVDGARCRLIELQGTRNVAISGGTLLGSRSGKPEWAVGILASDAQDLVIEDLTVRDFYLDGILLTGNAGCRNVVVRRVVADNNRRTGLAAPAAFDLTVEDSTFQGSRGQSPEAGMNCEPNPDGRVASVRVRNSRFAGNAGIGLYIHRGRGVSVTDAHVEGSRIEDNGAGIVAAGVDRVTIVRNRVTGHTQRGRSGIALGDLTTAARVEENELEGNYRGIVAAGASDVVIHKNTVVGTGARAGRGAGDDGDGIVCRGLRALLADACVVTENRVRLSAGSGIVAQLVSRVRVVDNVVEDTGQRGLHLRSALASEARGNQVARTGLELEQAYDAIELTHNANDNVVASNVCRLGAATRSGIGVDPSCRGNQLTANVVLPN